VLPRRRPRRPDRTRRSPAAGARAGLTLATAAAAVAVLLAACDATPSPPPTSAPPRTSPSPAHLSAVQKRCVAEGRLLIDASRVLQGIPSIESATPDRTGREAALSGIQGQLARLTARTLHRPFVSDQAALIRAANDMVAGYEGLLGRGNHKVDRANTALVTKGSSAAAGVEANVAVHRAQCLS
jgi:hypothetical protein